MSELGYDTIDIPMLDEGVQGGTTFDHLPHFDKTWGRLADSDSSYGLSSQLQHHYTLKAFGVDTRLHPFPLIPHRQGKTEWTRYRYFEYITKFMDDRTPENLKEKIK